MKTKHFIAAAALVAFPAAAHAQTDLTDAFSGPYVGAQAGWGQRSVNENLAGAGFPNFDRERSGIDYGAYFGFDSPVGTNFVLGGEAEIGGGGKTLHQTLTTGVTAEVDPKWNYMFSGRAGFLAGDRTLVYGRLGYGREKVGVSVTNTNAGGGSFSGNQWEDGAVYGGGIEYALTPSTSLRAEYRYKDFDGSYNPQQLLAGFSFRF